MGRWSQSRRRGTSVPQAPDFPLPPPGDAEWEFSTLGGGSGQCGGDIISGICPVGADGWEIQVTNDPDFVIDVGSATGACSDTLEPSADFGPPGDTVYGRARWLLGELPMSDWSVTKVLS